jgi:hypothetical protein
LRGKPYLALSEENELNQIQKGAGFLRFTKDIQRLVLEA